jgi:hypothetical protein
MVKRSTSETRAGAVRAPVITTFASERTAISAYFESAAEAVEGGQ